MQKILNLEQGIERIKIHAGFLSCRPIIIGITGGSCSGKGHFSRLLDNYLEDSSILTMDDYFKGKAFVADNNFDKPEALDLELLRYHILQLKLGNSIEKPVYYFATSTRVGYEPFNPTNKIIVEGLFCLNDLLRDQMNIKIFVDSSEEIRLNRRIERDIYRAKSTPERIKRRWDRDVQPCYLKYIEPQKKYADIIIKNE